MKAKLTVSVVIDLETGFYDAGVDPIKHEKIHGIASDGWAAIDHMSRLSQVSDQEFEVTLEEADE